MKKAKYEKMVLEGLYNHFSKYGYAMTRRSEEYIFRNDTSEIRFCHTIKRSDCLYYNFFYLAHHKEIDVLIERITVETMPSWMASPYFYQTSRKEYGSKISEMVGCPEYDNPPAYTVRNAIDVHSMVSHQIEYFDRVALKYLEKFTTLESIHNFLSPYLLNLNEAQLGYDSDEGLNGYFFPIDYMSLMISCWITEMESYPEVWRRISKIFQNLPIHKSYKLLDSILQEEHK